MTEDELKEASSELWKLYSRLDDLRYELDKVEGEIQCLSIKPSGEALFPQPSKSDDASTPTT